MLDEKKVERLKKLFDITNEGLTRKEFTASFKKVLDAILKVKAELEKNIDYKEGAERKKLEALGTKFEKTFTDLEKKMEQTVNRLFEGRNRSLEKQFEGANKTLGEVKERLANIKDGTPGAPGRDADETKIITETLKRVNILDHEAKLKDLDGGIKALEDELKVVKEIKSRGGGTSAMGVAQAFKWILKTEAPSGLINGSNTTYTVNFPIFAVLAFSLNGEVIAQIPNYTIANKTITFSTALPAAYSGKDFEIRYV